MQKIVQFEMRYDPEVDSGYVYFKPIGESEVAETITIDDLPSRVQGDINIDVDTNGMLLGIELLAVSKLLPKEILENFS